MMKRKWNKSEIEYLKSNHGIISIREIAKMLDRGISGVQHKARSLGLAIERPFWSAEDIEFLKFNYSSMTILEIAEILDRGPASIHHKAKSLDLINCDFFYTEDQKEYVAKHYFPGNSLFIAKKLNKSICSIRTMSHKLGIDKKTKSWESVDIQYLEEHYSDRTIPLKKMAEHLNTSVTALQTRAQRANLIRKKAVPKQYCVDCNREINKYNHGLRCFDCLLKHRKGENHPNWKGGITTLTDMIRKSLFWVWTYPIMKRDGFICQVCKKKTKGVHVHHIKPLKEIRDEVLSNNPELSIENDKIEIVSKVVALHKFAEGVTVCQRCHMDIHYSENGVNGWESLRDYIATTQPAMVNVKAQKNIVLGNQPASQKSNLLEASTTNSRLLPGYAEESNRDTSALDAAPCSIMI